MLFAVLRFYIAIFERKEVVGLAKMGPQTPPVDTWLTEDGITLITAWARDGATFEQICERIGVTNTTLLRWRKAHPELNKALMTSRELVNIKVENALLKLALGFESKEIKVTLGKKAVGGELYEVLKETTTKQVAPNVTACLAWLNNREFDKWKRNRDKVAETTEEDRNVRITIIRGKDSDDELGSETNKGVDFDIKVEDNKSKKKPERDPALDEWPEDWEDEE